MSQTLTTSAGPATASAPSGASANGPSARRSRVDGQSARRLQTRARLLQAGTELFAEHGVRAVTTTTIANRAGVATGTFYLHFEDKHALFDELVQEAVDEMGAPIDLDRFDHTDDAARRQGLEHMMQVAEGRRDLIRAVFDQGGGSDLVERIQDRIAARLELTYARLFLDGGVGLDPGGAAQARAAVLVRLVAWWANEPSPARRRDVVDLLFEMDPLRLNRLALAPSTPTSEAATTEP